MHELADLGARPARLLCAEDPRPYVIANPVGASRVLLICEHAARAIPLGIGRTGISDAEMETHIAYDIGAAEVALRLSRRLDAPLVLQPYSRLVVDCNRPAASPECVPQSSDGIAIPMNEALPSHLREARIAEIHEPFHARIGELIDAMSKANRRVVLISIHSFTPRLATENKHRPWHLGLLYNRDPRLSRLMLSAFEARFAGYVTGLNVPYRVEDHSDFTMPVHGERRGILHTLVEVRNDEIATAAGQDLWAALLGDIIEQAIGIEELETCSS